MKIKTTIYLPSLGADAEVAFDYSPAEKMTHSYPGCDESIDVTSIILDGTDLDLSMNELDQRDQDAITQACFDSVHAEQEMSNDEYEMLREQDHKESMMK